MKLTIKPGSFTFLISLAIIGVLLTVVAAFFTLSDHVFWVNFFAGLGAAVIGAAVSLLMARVLEPSKLDEVLGLIATSQSWSLIRDDKCVEPFRHQYHGYLLSSDNDVPSWRYRSFDFASAHTPGHLHAQVEAMLPGGEKKNFIYEGYVCLPHLILIGRPEAGTEAPVIHVFPYASELQGRPLAGIAFVHTFDGTQVVTPTLLSRNTLCPKLAAPASVPAYDAERLIRTWRDAFMKMNKFNGPLAAVHSSADK